MKKLTMICMSALLMLAVSCKKDKKTEIENAGSGFRATVESHEGTGKTHLDGFAVKWNSDDAILVKSSASACPEPKRFTTTGTDASANFVAAESLDGNFYTPDYTGYYPADKFSGDQLTLPATQTYVADAATFANGANPMAATSNATLLPFKNICGVLKLQLHNNSESPCNVANITITSNKEGEKLWGTGTVTFSGVIPSLGELTGGGNTLTLNCNGETMSTSSSSPSTYFFVVPVGTLGESFTVKVTDTDGKVWTKTANASANLIARSRITAMPKQAVTLAAPPPTFTVSSGVTVSFSPGNLQYLGQAEEGHKWRFAEHQWDYMGDGPNTTTGNKGNVDLGADYAGKYNTGSGSAGGSETADDKAAARDLFGWGATGYQDTRNVNHTNWYQTNYQPYSTSKTGVSSSDPAYNKNRYGYGPDCVSSPYYNLTVENKSDWGCVTGLPSAGEGKSWRTLSSAEWAWLLGPSSSPNPGTNCRTSSTINGTDNARYAEVKVNGVSGMMVFPDVFAWPSDVEFKPSTFNTNSSGWNDVDYSIADFGKLESAGVVFLPAAGSHDGTSVSNVGSYGGYWSSSYYNSSSAYYLLHFCSGTVNPDNNYYRYRGRSVRLVSEN